MNYCRDCERLSQDCDALSKDNNTLTARVETLEAALRVQTKWVQAALDCKTWVWDSDQRLAAMGCIIEANELIGSQSDGGSEHE